MATVDQRFCGGCGAELAATFHQQIEQIETDLRNAAQWQTQGQLDEALSLLIPIAKLTHVRLLRHAREAERKIEEITLLRGRGIREAGPVFEEGRRRMAKQDYAGAVKSLQTIPASTRSSEFAELLDQALAREREVAALGSALREAIAEKRYAELPKVLSRLLELQPQHADAVSVAAQLQKKCRAAAEEKLGRCQYEQALKVIEQVPRLAWTAETVEFHQRVADRAWLAATLRTAPVIDPVLVAAGRRAAELMPDDPGIAKLIEELQRRVKRSEKDDGIVPRAWAAAPAESPLGLPLDWCAGFRGIDLSETCDRRTLAEGRGCYGVACGLALQGLGLAAIPMDLRPKVGVVDFISGIARRRATRGAWGIDIGSSSLKVVKLAAAEEDGRPRLEIALRIEHQKSLGQANNEVEERALLEQTLATLLAKHDLKNGCVVVGLPGRMVFSRMLRLPPGDRGKLEAMVRHEVYRHMPVSIDALVWDYATLDPEEAGVHGPSARRVRATNGRAFFDKKTANAFGAPAGRRTSWNVLVTAARRSQVEKRLAVLEKLGVKPSVMESEWTALYNLLAYELDAAGRGPAAQDASDRNGPVGKDPPERADTAAAQAATADAKAGSGPLAAPIAVVDLGHEGSRLLVCSSNELWTQNLGFGGQFLTRALVKELNLTSAAAEQYKRDPLAAPSVAQIYRAAGPVIEDLLRELQVALDSVARREERPAIRKVYLLGGAVQFHGLLRFLQSGK
jgi:Tfp pilus assembly PilM family ATPase